MKPKPSFRAAVIASAFVMSLDGTRSQADDLRIVNKAFVGTDLFVGFVPDTTNWISIESSPDLLSWTNIASVATTNNATVFVDEDAAAAGTRFYRLRQPGFGVEDAEAKWLAHAGRDY